MCLYEFRQVKRFNYRRFWNYFSDNVNGDVDDDKEYFYVINQQCKIAKSLFTKAKKVVLFAKDFSKSIEKALTCISLQKSPKHTNQFWQDCTQHDFSYIFKKLFLNAKKPISNDDIGNYR